MNPWFVLFAADDDAARGAISAGVGAADCAALRSEPLLLAPVSAFDPALPLLASPDMKVIFFGPEPPV
jgi:hypothetical protein